MAFERKLFLDIFARDRGASKVLGDVGDKSDRAADRVDELSESTDGLDASIVRTRGNLKKLLGEFARTGDVELFPQIRAARREANFVAGIGKTLGELAEPVVDMGIKAGFKTGEGFLKALTSAVGKGGPAIIGVMSVFLASVVAFTGAAIGGAILGGVGAGGLIGGVMAASADPRVKEAGTRFSETFMSSFADAGQPMVAPVIDGLARLEMTASGSAATMKQSFTSLGAVIKPVTEGIQGFTSEIMPGFTRGLESSKPVLRMLGNELPKIGRAIGDMIDDISDESDGAILGLQTLLGLTASLIRGVGNVASSLSAMYEGLVRVNTGVAGFLETTLGWAPVVGDIFSDQAQKSRDAVAGLDAAHDSSRDFAGGLEDVADAASMASDRITRLVDLFRELFGIQMSVDQANVRFHQSLRDLNDELTDGERTLRLNSEAGLANRDAVLSHITAVEGLRQANIDNNMSVEAANTIYDQQLAQLEAVLIKLGYNKQEVRDLVAAYRAIPLNVSSTVKIEGLEGTTAKVRELARLLGSVAAGAAAASGGSYVSGRASGGPVDAGTTYMVGEEGPELVKFDRSGYVINARDTAAMMGSPRAMGSGGGGGGPQPIYITFSLTGDPLMDAIAVQMRERVRAESGSDVVLYFTGSPGPRS